MSLKAFFKENANVNKTKEVVISQRFKDEDGNIIPFTIKTISATEISEIQAQSMKKKDGINDFDSNVFLSKLTAAAVVYPDLKDASLQKSYGVLGEEALLKEMLISGEYNTLSSLVQALNGMDENIQDLIKQVKN